MPHTSSYAPHQSQPTNQPTNQPPCCPQSQAFVANPFYRRWSHLERDWEATMYRTGDLAKWLPDGNLLFMGRVDQQVGGPGGETKGRLDRPVHKNILRHGLISAEC